MAAENLEDVVSGGYCIGCGACGFASNGLVRIETNKIGQYSPIIPAKEVLPQSIERKALAMCPFSGRGADEDSIGAKHFSRHCDHDPRIGFYAGLFAGSVAEDDFRARGTSGGMITWVLAALLKSKKVDAVIHVRPTNANEDGILFRYEVSDDIDKILNGAKSRYYPVEMSRVLAMVKQTPGRYAVVGLPCFIKAIRLAAENDSEIRERVAFSIGLVCGHLKSKAFSESYALQVGIKPDRLEDIDFRVKLANRTANDYGVYLKGDTTETTVVASELFGSNWGHNFFRYSACDYCDDVFAETADLAVGDAWLPEYEEDSKGTSIVVIRNAELLALVQDARNDGRLDLVDANPETIALSQAGGLRDRREGLAYRLYLRKKARKWVPRKRVTPSRKSIGFVRRKIYKLRSEMGEASHRHWLNNKLSNSYGQFDIEMKKLTSEYASLYLKSQPIRRRIRKLISRIYLGLKNL